MVQNTKSLYGGGRSLRCSDMLDGDCTRLHMSLEPNSLIFGRVRGTGEWSETELIQ